MNSDPKILDGVPRSFLSMRHIESVQIYKSKSDGEIWRQFNGGDEVAFNYIYRTYIENMFRFGCQMTKDEFLIQDSIQNIFVDLRRKRGKLGDVQTINPYLLKMLYREILKHIRENKMVLQGESEIAEKFFQVEFSHETRLIQEENQLQRSVEVREAMNRLSDKQRQAILLLYEEGMTYKEISVAMELKEAKSARKVIYTALASLKSMLIPLTKNR